MYVTYLFVIILMCIVFGPVAISLIKMFEFEFGMKNLELFRNIFLTNIVKGPYKNELVFAFNINITKQTYIESFSMPRWLTMSRGFKCNHTSHIFANINQ